MTNKVSTENTAARQESTIGNTKVGADDLHNEDTISEIKADRKTGKEELESKAPEEGAKEPLSKEKDAAVVDITEIRDPDILGGVFIGEVPASDEKVSGLVREVVKDLVAAGVASGIHEGGKYILKIPAKYLDSRGKAAGGAAAEELLPMLFRELGDGKAELVSSGISSEEAAIGLLSVQNCLMAFQNLLLGEEIYQVSLQIREVSETANRIAKGQQSDRYGKLMAGRMRLKAALGMEKEERRRELDSAISLIAEGQQQIFFAMKNEIEGFRAIPEAELARNLAEIFSPGYFDAKDAAFESAQNMYAAYLLATKLLALSYAASGHREIGKEIFEQAKEDLDSIDYTSIRTIGVLHPEQMKKAFFNSYEDNLRFEEKRVSGEPTSISVELTGTQLLEALQEERKESANEDTDKG